MMYKVKGYEGIYWINECGTVTNHSGHMIKPSQSRFGYLRIVLVDRDGNKNNESIHRLVAKTLIENPDPEHKTVVMHLDNDKLNNHVSNLKWGTPSENSQQAFDDGLFTMYPGKIYHEYILNNKQTGDTEIVKTRDAVAEKIGYKFISLKNMVGNGREITKGPYKGYTIDLGRRIKKPVYYLDEK